MSGCEYVDYLVNHYVFEQIPGFFDQLSIQTDGSLFRVAASPFGLHALQEIALDFDPNLAFPLLDQWRYRRMKKLKVPIVYHLRADLQSASGTHLKVNCSVIQAHGGLTVTFRHLQQMSTTP